MKIKRYKSSEKLAEALGLPKEVGQLSELKADLTVEIINTLAESGLTHQNVADISGIPRSAVTGIINSSLQKVSLDRLIRILYALGKRIELKVEDVA